jgi:ribosome-binding protein aMBF1 (putative translation factor)
MYQVCEICGKIATERHHIFNGAMRNKSEDYGAVIRVCRNCHNMIHKNAELRMKLKAIWQEKLMIDNNWSEADFISVFKKNYRSEENDTD